MVSTRTVTVQGWLACLVVGVGLTPIGCGAEPDAAGGDGAGEAATTPGAQPSDVKVESALEVNRMSAWLEQHRVEPAKVRRSLWTRQGRRVNCVGVMDQPAVKVHGLTGIETPPVVEPDDAVDTDGAATPFSQQVHRQRALPEALRAANSITAPDATCDEGTVPIADVTLDDLKRFKTLDHFLRKPPSAARAAALRNGLAPQKLETPAHNGPSNLHQYATVNMNGINLWGALSTINVWKPYTELSNEISLSQIWVARGGVGVYQSLEVGSIVYRDLFGDDVPHLFIYSTQDDYVSTGCWNGSCGDFVQTGNTVFPGQTLSPYSTPGAGNQWETPVRWVKSGNGGNWWLWVNGAYVGYYPRSLYSAAGVRDFADTMSFGGEITDHENLGLHTSTEMGSGYTPSSGYGFAAYQSSMRYFYKVDANGTVRFKNIPAMNPKVTDALCYDLGYVSGDTTIYFGGHGYNRTNCQ